jgi:putative hemolysin
VIPRAQEELLHNVFDFAEREAGDIMVPALDVDWLDAGLTPESALDRVLEAPHERYPVGHGSLDHLDGVVHLRDLLAAARGAGRTSVFELARPVLGIPENKDLGALLIR